jgi:cytochrome bd-type quinol oxidase subunit 2
LRCLSSWAERIGIGAEQYDMAIDWLVGCTRHFAGVEGRRDGRPFAMTVLFFLASFATLAVLFWLYMIPYSITVGSAAAPEASLSFLFWGAGLFVLPVSAMSGLRRNPKGDL